jgi:hypothetical protein
MYSSTLSLTSLLDGEGFKRYSLTALSPVKEARDPLCRRLGGPQPTVHLLRVVMCATCLSSCLWVSLFCIAIGKRYNSGMCLCECERHIPTSA